MADLTNLRNRKTVIGITIVLAALAALAGVVLVLVRWRKRRAEKLTQEELLAPSTLPARIQGLTEAEAESRRMEGQDNAIRFSPPRTRTSSSAGIIRGPNAAPGP